MATLAVEQIAETGLAATYNTAAAGGDTFDNDTSGRIFILVKNGDASSMTVSCALAKNPPSIDGFGVIKKDPISVSVPATDERLIGPFPYDAYGANPDIQYTSVTSLTVAVLKM